MKILAVLAALLALAGCDQAPQVLEAAENPGYQTDAWPDQQRARTLRQGESGRIYP